MNRGAGRRKIFANDYHRKIFLACLEEASNMFDIQIHAYCLMDNHYHLLIHTPNGSLSRAMRHINGVYTQRYNRSKKTDGPLFRGRYKAKLIEEDCYLLLVSRYIHLNPVEAKLVSCPAKYRWSSYSDYLNKNKKNDWLYTHIIKERLVETASLKHTRDYKDYVENHTVDELSIFNSTKYTSPIIGTEKFRKEALAKADASKQNACAPDVKRARPTPPLSKIISITAQHFDVTLKEVENSRRGQLNQPKLLCIYICRKKCGYALSEIAKAFKPISRNTVSTTVSKCEKLISTDRGIANRLELILRDLNI